MQLIRDEYPAIFFAVLCPTFSNLHDVIECLEEYFSLFTWVTILLCSLCSITLIQPPKRSKASNRMTHLFCSCVHLNLFLNKKYHTSLYNLRSYFYSEDAFVAVVSVFNLKNYNSLVYSWIITASSSLITMHSEKSVKTILRKWSVERLRSCCKYVYDVLASRLSLPIDLLSW